MPSISVYQAARAFGSLERRKMPPMPVTRAMAFSWKLLGGMGQIVYEFRHSPAVDRFARQFQSCCQIARMIGRDQYGCGVEQDHVSPRPRFAGKDRAQNVWVMKAVRAGDRCHGSVGEAEIF